MSWINAKKGKGSKLLKDREFRGIRKDKGKDENWGRQTKNMPFTKKRYARKKNGNWALKHTQNCNEAREAEEKTGNS